MYGGFVVFTSLGEPVASRLQARAECCSPLESPGATTSSLAGTALWLEGEVGAAVVAEAFSCVEEGGTSLAEKKKNDRRSSVSPVLLPAGCVAAAGKRSAGLCVFAQTPPLSLSLPSFLLQSLTDSRLDVCVYVTAYVRMSVLSFFFIISVLHLGLFFPPLFECMCT